MVNVVYPIPCQPLKPHILEGASADPQGTTITSLLVINLSERLRWVTSCASCRNRIWRQLWCKENVNFTFNISHASWWCVQVLVEQRVRAHVTECSTQEQESPHPWWHDEHRVRKLNWAESCLGGMGMSEWLNERKNGRYPWCVICMGFWDQLMTG